MLSSLANAESVTGAFLINLAETRGVKWCEVVVRNQLLGDVWGTWHGLSAVLVVPVGGHFLSALAANLYSSYGSNLYSSYSSFM